MVQLMLEDKRDFSKMQITKDIEASIQSGKLSIWDLGEFPSSTRPYKFSPAKLRELLDEYAMCNMGINKLAIKHSIPEKSIYILTKRYTEIGSYYEQCTKQKAIKHNEKSVDIWEEELTPDDYKETRYGRELNYAAVVRRDRKSQMYARQAALLDRDKFGEKQQIESTVKSFNITRTIDGTGEKANKSLMDLFSAFNK